MAQLKNNLKNLKIQERGAALIVFLTILVLATTTILLSELNRVDFQIEQQKQTARVLAQAKEALLGFALTYAETHQGQMPGYLPCPDSNGNGSAGPSCSSQGNSVIGRFPWRTLGLPPLRDGSGECLWYAVSGTYKNNPKQILSNTTKGLFIIKNAKGDTITDNAIAILFAPGRAIDGNRTAAANDKPCGDNVQILDYLDSLEIDENGDSVPDYTIKNFSGQKTGEVSGNPGGDQLPTATPSVFIKAPVIREDTNNVIFNDTLMSITPEDFAPVYERMNAWVAKQVVKCLESYAANNGGEYPWASKVDPYDYTADSGERFGRIPDDPAYDGDCFDESSGLNDWKWGWWSVWKEMVFFAVNPTLTTATETKSVNLLVLVAGSEINGQTRYDKTDIGNYLEGENADADEYFISQAVTDNFNDVVCWNSECRQ